MQLSGFGHALANNLSGRAVGAFPQAHPDGVFADDRLSIVAKCGADTKVIRLPWGADVDMVKLSRPEIAALLTLERTVGSKAFGPFPSIDVIPVEIADQLQPASEAILAELKSGKFDAGLAGLADRDSFRKDAVAFRPKPKVKPVTVRLANADQFHFDRYVHPQYPGLARAARISGKVELELTSNPATGEMEQVKIISGHPVLTPSAAATAQQWRVAPGPETALRAARVVLEFVSNCP
jgi:TonB family protein